MPHLRIEKEHAVNAASLSKALRERLDLSRPQMARWLGVTRQYISKLEGGVPPSKPVLLLLLKLEEESRQHPELNGQPKELVPPLNGFPLPQPLVATLESWQQAQAPEAPSQDLRAPSPSERGVTTPPPNLERRGSPTPPFRETGLPSSIPLLGMHEAAGLKEIETVRLGARQVLVFPTLDQKALAVRIAGEAMWPRCMDGDIAILYPSLEPRNGDLVLVRPRDEKGGGLLLRLIHLTEGDGTLYLTCNHSASPSISLFRNDCLWMAPVVAIIRQLR